MKSKFLFASICSFAFLSSCNGAQFSGKGGGTADPPPPAVKSLSCSINPDKIKVGEKATISIKSGSELRGPVEQRVISQAGTTKSVINASIAPSGQEFAKSDGGPNEISFNSPGDVTVELRIQENSATPDAKCDLAVLSNPSASPTPATPERPCQPGQTAIGAYVAFLIDNSNSNAATDCPGARKTGTFRDADVYQCGGQTAREGAVLSAYDILSSVAAANANREESRSLLSVAEFPTQQDFVAGYHIHGNWIVAEGNGRTQLSSALSFTRSPFGITPYGAAIAAGDRLFSAGIANDGKARVAILVTDGEPTDQDPEAVASAAAALRNKGVEVITVFVTNGEKRSSREATHVSMLKSFEGAVQRAGQGHWYASRYGSFESYISSLLGREGHQSLSERVASPVEASCTGAGCRRQIIEVSDAAGLKAAIQGIIKSKGVQCQ